jgi:hypothetical protein
MLVPEAAEGQAEILWVLMKCRSEAHCEAVVTAFLETKFECRNIVAELTLLSSQISEIGAALPGPCINCAGREFLSVDLERLNRFGERMTFAVSARCSCPRGRDLAQRDSARGRDAEHEAALATTRRW